MTSPGHTGERAIHSSDFSAEKNPVGSVRSLAAYAASHSLFREQGLRELPETFSFIGNSTLRSFYASGTIYQTRQAEKHCLSGPIMNQQHTVSSNRQNLGTWSRINVKVVKLDKSVWRRPSSRNTNMFQGYPSKKSLRGGYAPSRMHPKTKR